jgi:hypothetical protein
MGAKSEFDAAYYTMLRAVEERDSLLRYRDYLHAERERLNEFEDATYTRADPIPRKVRRPVDQTTKPMLETVGARRSVVLDELGRLDDRVSAAEAFVVECEEEVAALRG